MKKPKVIHLVSRETPFTYCGLYLRDFNVGQTFKFRHATCKKCLRKICCPHGDSSYVADKTGNKKSLL